VVKGANLSFNRGEFISLLGPSGCGKTTILRMVAGFERPTSGNILVEGKDITPLAPNQRQIGMVFQAYALFPNMNVEDNVAFGLKIAGMPAEQRRARVDEMLKLIGLAGFGKRFPFEMSGGQQQRVALARALAPKPRMLLLDEPLSALDAKIRVSLRQEIRSIQRDLGITTIFVTHDQEEAFDLADRIVIMNGGKICQEGAPLDIYQQPADVFVHEFLGESNHITGHAAGGIVFADAGFPIAEAANAPDGPLNIYIRPHHVLLRPRTGQNGHGNGGGWIINRISATGAHARISVGNGTTTLEASMTVDALIASGLTDHTPVDIIFAGGTVFSSSASAPQKLQALKPRLAG
jgi:putative spermidine/putrescine transport system ATP-binding protein